MFCWCFAPPRNTCCAFIARLPIAKSAQTHFFSFVRLFLNDSSFFSFVLVILHVLWAILNSITIAFISLIFPFSQHSLLSLSVYLSVGKCSWYALSTQYTTYNHLSCRLFDAQNGFVNENTTKPELHTKSHLAITHDDIVKSNSSHFFLMPIHSQCTWCDSVATGGKFKFYCNNVFFFISS